MDYGLFVFSFFLTLYNLKFVRYCIWFKELISNWSYGFFFFKRITEHHSKAIEFNFTKHPQVFKFKQKQWFQMLAQSQQLGGGSINYINHRYLFYCPTPTKTRMESRINLSTIWMLTIRTDETLLSIFPSILMPSCCPSSIRKK